MGLNLMAKVKRIEVKGGVHGSDTHVLIDGVEQENLTSVVLVLKADGYNEVALTYKGVDVDIDTEVIGTNVYTYTKKA